MTTSCSIVLIDPTIQSCVYVINHVMRTRGAHDIMWPHFCRGNKDRALELYEKGIQYSRTKAEMAQAYIACEIVTSQEAACQEYGITTSDLAARSVPGLQ